jgi:hypothetical protein
MSVILRYRKLSVRTGGNASEYLKKFPYKIRDNLIHETTMKQNFPRSVTKTIYSLQPSLEEFDTPITASPSA